MNTPITDEASFSTVHQGELVKASFARRLELDRAALMEALELAETYLIERGIATRGTTGRTVVLPKMQAALAAARANFPTP